jgi:hypothetical protein
MVRVAQQADLRRDSRIGTKHLLLGLLLATGDPAVRRLSRLGADYDAARTEIARLRSTRHRSALTNRAARNTGKPETQASPKHRQARNTGKPETQASPKHRRTRNAGEPGGINPPGLPASVLVPEVRLWPSRTRPRAVVSTRSGHRPANPGPADGGPSAGHRSVSIERCRTGRCRTGRCRTGRCRTGRCRTGRCRTERCRTGRCRTGRCGTGRCGAAPPPARRPAGGRRSGQAVAGTSPMTRRMCTSPLTVRT